MTEDVDGTITNRYGDPIDLDVVEHYAKGLPTFSPDKEYMLALVDFARSQMKEN